MLTPTRILFSLLVTSFSCSVGFAQEYDRKQANVVTFNQHIAPIVHEKCTSCHRPGQAGPFSLITFNDVSRRARTIDAVIDSGYMPPWKPVNDSVVYHNDRRLSPWQKKLFRQWLEDGKPQGEGSPPAPPEFPDGWQLGKPDLVVTMKGKFEVPADGPDVYRSFVFPIQLPQDRWVKAIEYRPTATSSVHHAIFFVDSTGNARAMDGKDGKPGIEGMGFLSPSAIQGVRKADGQSGLRGLLSKARFAKANAAEPVANPLSRGLGGYVPGTTPAKLPGDLALPLPKQNDIVMQTHFHPSGKPEIEGGQIALYFAEKAPSKQIVPIQIPAMFGVGVGLKVPAGESNYTVSESFTTPVDIRLISIGAHAHYICRSAKMTAKLPNGDTKVLLNIDDWDLDWQDRYYFENAVVLPEERCLQVNLSMTTLRPIRKNPNSPPVEIRWGRESGDEMGSVTVQAIAVDETQRPQVAIGAAKYYVASISQGDLIDLLMQLDTNRDGGLQPAENGPLDWPVDSKFWIATEAAPSSQMNWRSSRKSCVGCSNSNRKTRRFK